MAYLVTGGTGFLGQHLVQRLVQQEQAQVRVVTRTPPARDTRVPSVEYVQGSVLDSQLLRSALQGVSGVFHLAGVVEHSRRGAANINDTNVLGTLAVVGAAADVGVRRVVYASTSGVVAAARSPPFPLPDDNAPYASQATARWPYYASKIAAERGALQLARERGIELVCMRPSLLLGPGDERLSSCRSVLDLMTGKVPFVPSGGVSFVDVRDAADAFAVAMAAGRPGATYLLGCANLPCAEYFRGVEAASGVPGPRLVIPDALAWLLAYVLWRGKGLFGVWDPSLDPVYVEMAQAFWYLDACAARQDIGFAPRPAEETLRDTVTYLRGRFGVA